MCVCAHMDPQQPREEERRAVAVATPAKPEQTRRSENICSADQTSCVVLDRRSKVSNWAGVTGRTPEHAGYLATITAKKEHQWART